MERQSSIVDSGRARQVCPRVWKKMPCLRRTGSDVALKTVRASRTENLVQRKVLWRRPRLTRSVSRLSLSAIAWA